VSFEWLYALRLIVLLPAVFVLVEAAAELGNRIGLRFRAANAGKADFGTLTGAALGLLALLVAFSISMAESL
jgi:hypothetical protein